MRFFFPAWIRVKDRFRWIRRWRCSARVVRSFVVSSAHPLIRRRFSTMSHMIRVPYVELSPPAPSPRTCPLSARATASSPTPPRSRCLRLLVPVDDAPSPWWPAQARTRTRRASLSPSPPNASPPPPPRRWLFSPRTPPAPSSTPEVRTRTNRRKTPLAPRSSSSRRPTSSSSLYQILSLGCCFFFHHSILPVTIG